VRVRMAAPPPLPPPPLEYANPFEAAKAVWNAVRIPNFETDASPAARALRERLEELDAQGEVRARGGLEASRLPPVDTLAELQEVGGLMGTYYQEKLSNSFNNAVVRDALPKVGALFNVAFIAVVLRLLLPRLLAINTMSELEDNLGFLGIPSRAEMASYVAQVDALPLSLKLGGFIGIMVVEKLLCVTEFTPLGIILPTLSPVLFGGVVQGAAVSVVGSATGATLNFALGRRFFSERIRTLQIFGGAPLGEAAWFTAVNRNFEREGFKTALMLRLAPILPIPIDAHWYLCGVSTVPLAEFVAAQCVGSLKFAFIDAYFGSMLMAELVPGRDLGLPAQTKWVLVAEVVAVILTSVLVTSVATSTLNRVLREEGWDRATATPFGTGPPGEPEGPELPR
jgi:uncharacterized membrane protein YdjX (TVP38/TMEM64 family)